MSKYKKKMYLIVLFAFSFISVFWMMSIDNSFSYDDVSWMLNVSLSSYEDLFSFFPHSVYLDRPIGAIFLKLLYNLFGLDYGRHHVILVIIHLLNVLLVFVVTGRTFKRKYEDRDRCFRGGIITAAFFGIWSRTHMAVQWDAAIFDLLGTFWSLISIYFYLQYRNEEKYKKQNIFFMLLFYFFSIRTKEMFIILPLLFILYEIWEMFLEKKAGKFTLGTCICMAVFVLFAGILFYHKLSGGDGLVNDVTNPYYYTFHPIKLMVNLLRYSILCFDLEKGGWIYTFSISGLTGTLILIVGLIAAIVKAVKNKSVELLLCYGAIGISIAVVLPMINMTHVLYLYFPAIFVGMLMACIMVGWNVSDNGLLLIMCLFLATGGMAGNTKTRDYWLEDARFEKRAWDDIKDIQAPMSGATIYIKNLDGKEYTPFFYGEGAVCRLLYNDASLSVEILEGKGEEKTEYLKPYVVWEYENGEVHEIERNEERHLFIDEVYQYPQENGELILGIVPDKISNPMVVYIDGTRLEPVIGETFISVQIPAELVAGKEKIELSIEDAYGVLSEAYAVIIESQIISD